MSAVFVDVDGTLLLWPGDKPGRPPRPGDTGHGEEPTVNEAVVARVRELHAQGYQIVLWSSGGAFHAQDASRRCDIRPLVHAHVAKPSVIIDDAGIRWIDKRYRKGALTVEIPDGRQ